ncbi:MAG TPA: hypothetical protein VFG20_02930 [Planctomycetaceae bacterium]|nr:hypothetical protein [Planctomycetaceae bacterium]
MSEKPLSSTPSQRTIEELLDEFSRVNAEAEALQARLAEIERQLEQRGIPRHRDSSGEDTVEF